MVVEATGNAWWCYDIVAPPVGRAVVANSLRVLTAHLIPEVRVPPAHVRELRALLVHRHALVNQQTAAKNRRHSLLRRHHLTPPPGDRERAKAEAQAMAEALR